MYKTALIAFDVPFCQWVRHTAEPGVRGWQGGLSVEGYHAIPAAADGDGEVQEKSVAGRAGCREWVWQASSGMPVNVVKGKSVGIWCCRRSLLNRRRSTCHCGRLVDLMRLRPVIPLQISLQPEYLANRGYANSKNNIIQKNSLSKLHSSPPPPIRSSEPQTAA